MHHIEMLELALASKKGSLATRLQHLGWLENDEMHTGSDDFGNMVDHDIKWITACIAEYHLCIADLEAALKHERRSSN